MCYIANIHTHLNISDLIYHLVRLNTAVRRLFLWLQYHDGFFLPGLGFIYKSVSARVTLRAHVDYKKVTKHVAICIKIHNKYLTPTFYQISSWLLWFDRSTIVFICVYSELFLLSMADFQWVKSLNFRSCWNCQQEKRYEMNIACLFEIKAISDILNYFLINTTYWESVFMGMYLLIVGRSLTVGA